ncbi:MAG TPA: hypothetical protein VK454_02125 [Myxococcaceae bacterium]|nr:hypothetical protein [Myxococcaceae bacterium]
MGLVAAAATLLLFWRVALTSDLLLRRDMLRVVLPLKAFWAERVRAGAWPQWYPYDALGQPFAGMVVSGAFHPANLLFLVLPAAVALKWSALLCFPALALGVWLLLRRLSLSPPACALASVLVSLSGYAVCITNSLPYLQAMAAVPWALWASVRFFDRPGVARGVLAGLLLALVLFAGDTQSFFVACALTLPLALLLPGPGRAGVRLLAWGLLLLAAALVAAPQLAAAAQVMGDARTADRPLAEALLWSMHPIRLLEVAVGPLFGTGELGRESAVTDALLGSGMGGLWVESVHFGALGLLLAGAGLAALPAGRVRRTMGVALAAGLLLVLGKYGGLSAVLYRLLPLWRPFRYPEKLVPYLFLLLAGCAAVGLDRALERPELRRRLRRAALGGVGCLAALALAEASLHAFGRTCQWLAGGALGEEALEALRANLFSACLPSGLALLGLWLVLSLLERRRSLVWLVPLGAGLVAFLQGERLPGAVSPGALDEPLTVQALRAVQGPPHLGAPRVYSAVSGRRAIPLLLGVPFEDLDTAATTTGLEPVTPALFGVEGSNLYLPAASARAAAVARAPGFVPRLLGALDTAHAAIPADDYLAAGGPPERVVGRSPRLKLLLVSLPEVAPRAALRRPRCVATLDEALRALGDPSVDLRHEAIVECTGRSPPGDREAAGDGEVRIVRYLPERVELEVRSERGGALVLADAFYSGWRATVDGRAAQLLPANVAVRALLISGGPHRVELSFRTPGLLPAAALALLTLAVGAAFAAAGRLRARRGMPG